MKSLTQELPDSTDAHQHQNRFCVGSKDGRGSIDTENRLQARLQPGGDHKDQCGEIKEPHLTTMKWMNCLYRDSVRIGQ